MACEVLILEVWGSLYHRCFDVWSILIQCKPAPLSQIPILAVHEVILSTMLVYIFCIYCIYIYCIYICIYCIYILYIYIYIVYIYIYMYIVCTYRYIYCVYIYIYVYIYIFTIYIYILYILTQVFYGHQTWGSGYGGHALGTLHDRWLLRTCSPGRTVAKVGVFPA